MNVKTIFERNALASFDCQVARAGGLLLEIVDSEWIRREQAVVADVPPRGMPRIVRVIENGDAEGLAFDRPAVIAPGRLFAPRVFARHARAQDDVPGRLTLV